MAPFRFLKKPVLLSNKKKKVILQSFKIVTLINKLNLSCNYNTYYNVIEHKSGLLAGQVEQIYRQPEQSAERYKIMANNKLCI